MDPSLLQLLALTITLSRSLLLLRTSLHTANTAVSVYDKGNTLLRRLTRRTSPAPTVLMVSDGVESCLGDAFLVVDL